MLKKKLFIPIIMGTVLTSFAVASVPDAPGSYIGVTKLTDTSVRINFLDNSDNEMGFKVFADGINISVPAHDETEHPQVYVNMTGLTCDKSYQVYAIAYNNDGNSTPSDTRSFNLNTTFSTGCNATQVAPIANAGVDQIVEESTVVQLDGTASSDADGDALTYQWAITSKPGGSSATLNDNTLDNPTFTADVIGTYTVELIVNDGTQNSIVDTVIINANLIVDHELNICNVWSASNSGGVAGTFDRWDISQIPAGASFDFEFQAYSVPDKFQVDYNGTNRLKTGWRGSRTPNTGEAIEGPGRFNKYGLFIKEESNIMTVLVTGEQPGTAWNYKVRCIEHNGE